MKKGNVLQETPLKLFLLAAGFLIVLYVFYILSVAGSEEAEKRVCMATLALQSATTVGPLDSPLSTECKRRFIEIRDNKVVKVRNNAMDEEIKVWMDGKPVTKYTHINDDVIESVFAESMRRCWEIGLEGEKRIFDSGSLIDKETVCLICDQIEVKAEPDMNNPENEREYLGGDKFTQYLTSTEMPLDRNKRTYEEYMFTPYTIKGEEKPPAQTDTGRELQLAAEIIDRLYRDAVSGDRGCLQAVGVDEDPVVTSGTYATVLLRDFANFQGGCMAVYVMSASEVRAVCEHTVN